MLNLLVETKNEYTVHLINILTPLVFQGLQSIYNEAKNIVNNKGDTNMVLKIFQSCLKSIITWNTITIEKATNTIISSSQSYEWLNDLIKATLKANLIVLLYNPTCKNQIKVDPSFYKSVKTTDFIHRIYIECARELWNNPYLMYHEYPPIEIKRNQRDCILIIKDSIKEAIRKLLPVKHILQIYLNEDIDINKGNDNFDKAISDVEENYLPKLLKKDLNTNNSLQQESNDNKLLDVNELKKKSDITNSSNNSDELTKSTNNKSNTSDSNVSNNNLKKEINNNSNTSSFNEKTQSQGSIILDIINESPNSKVSIDIVNKNNDSVVTIQNKNIANSIFTSCDNDKKIINNLDDSSVSSKMIVNNKDSIKRVKEILQNLAPGESDINDTPSLTNENYQEIFSNSNTINKNN